MVRGACHCHILCDRVAIFTGNFDQGTQSMRHTFIIICEVIAHLARRRLLGIVLRG
ncbi:hypothetical protein ROLI_040620 [Roseobacter fucihabitans]|uniref:Uncharacterized protein n=1 Tax=Roseobacter fucihabitans TaxID=1537242 RepID=A0ABZ2BYS9_9RHOB|nr:hypothetical protein [Roseobacter litoralis]MBC6965839.1 hypothetical protein [Roseobacter litoralis]